MIRGLQKKIIVVESPDPAVFEQAIFIVRDDVAASGRVGQEQMLRQARQAASAYMDGAVVTRPKLSILQKFPRTIYAACAAAAAAAAWIAARFVGV